MLTALFSVTFTSCIDNEVSPLVEAIYEAQADLIAAQAGVQNAEAALRLAQANATEANAAYTAALTASVEIENAHDTLANEQLLRELIAETDLAVAVAQNDLAEAQVQFNLDMAILMAELAEAGAVDAAAYAAKYALHVGNVNTLTSTLIGKKASLALKELMLMGGTPNVSWEFYLAGLNSELATLEGDLAANLAAIAGYEEAMDNPTGIAAQRADLVAQIAALEDENVGLAVDIAEAENVRLAAAAELTAAGTWVTNVYNPAKSLVTNAEVSKKALVDENVILLEDIGDLDLALADYTAALEAAELAVSNAETAYDAAWLALGEENGAGADVAYNLYFEVDADGDPIAAGGSKKYVAPANLQEVYVNARIDYLAAADGFDDYQADFDALIATYNAAAAELVVQQAAFDGGTWTADLATANDDLDTANDDLLVAQNAYAAAKTTFEADPTGTVNTDGPVDVVTDLGYLGIHTDLPGTKTYMRVATFTETFGGSGVYVPNTFLPTKYTAASLATYLNTAVTGLYALDGTLTASTTDDPTAKYAVSDDTQVVLWEQDGTSTDAAGAVSILGGGVVATLTPTNVQDATSVPGNLNIEYAYFVEVESDDSSISKLASFNIATNMLGTNSFASRSFTTDGLPKSGTNSWTVALAFGDTDAGYLSTWDGTGVMGAADELTAQAVVWNAKLELAEKQYAFDNSSTALTEAQTAYDYQQELFDFGAANLALLADDLDAAGTAQDDAQDAVDHAWLKLGVEYVAGTDVDAKKTTSTAGAWYDADFSGPGTAKALTLNAVVFNAEVTLAVFEATTEEAILLERDTYQATFDDNLLLIAEYDILIAKYQADLDALEAQHDELVNTPLFASLQVALLEAEQAKAALEAQVDANNAMTISLQAVIDAIDANYTIDDYAALISALESSNVTLAASIEAKKSAIAIGEITVAGISEDIAALETEIAALEAQIVIEQALADKYKALMEAALAS